MMDGGWWTADQLRRLEPHSTKQTDRGLTRGPMIEEVMGCHGCWNGRLIRHEADQVQSKGNTKIDRPFIVIFVANQNMVMATDIVRQIHGTILLVSDTDT